jgi:FAD-dependent urate hydroxylase
MSSSRRAVIIGAGIAGPAAAMALQKAGIEATVYESQPAGADAAGSFLTVASNGLDALRTLGADQPVLEAGFPTPSITLRSARGKLLGQTPTGWSVPGGPASQTIKRADLYRALYAEAAGRGIRIEHGQRLTAARETQTGVEVTFTDGSQTTGDILIGADGLRSAVRPLIDPRAPDPAYLGLVSIGGYARGVDVATRPGGYEMIFGRHAFFGYALAPDGQVWWFANLPRRPEPARGDLAAADPETWRRPLLDAFASDRGPATQLIAATAELSPAFAIHALPHLPHWHSERMIVIGDAAHAPSPTSGQGASLAVEDAVLLARLLRDSGSPALAFRYFERTRRPRVERIIKQAARVSSSKAAGPVGRVIRDAMMPAVMKLAAGAGSRASRQTYGYHIDWDDPRAPSDVTAGRANRN